MRYSLRTLVVATVVGPPLIGVAVTRPRDVAAWLENLPGLASLALIGACFGFGLLQLLNRFRIDGVEPAPREAFKWKLQFPTLVELLLIALVMVAMYYVLRL
jgi:ABC-type Fe3+ transport system permease subunit